MNSVSSAGHLGEDELENIWKEDIASVVFRSARRDEAPVSIWLGGQPGAGKSSAAKSACRLYPDKSVVLIDGDDYRQYHPLYVDVMRANPAQMPEITQQAEGRWIAMSVSYALKQGYSSLIEGTWRNAEIVLKESRRAKHLKRKTHACVIGVSPFESGIGILRRYIDARLVGRGARWTSPASHDGVVKRLPQNVRAIATDESVDRFTVLNRDGVVQFDSVGFEDRDEAVSSWEGLFSKAFRSDEKREMVRELCRLARHFRRYDPGNTAALSYIEKLLARLRVA